MKMKILSVLGLMLLVGACASRPASHEGIEHPRPKKVASLVGKDRGQIHSLMGGPHVARIEEEYTLWSYATDRDHALLVYFDRDGVVKHAETRTAAVQPIKK